MWRSLICGVLLLFAVTELSVAQFEGKAIYEITYVIDNPELEGIDKQLPFKCKFVTDGKSWKATWKSRIGEDYTMIYHQTSDSLFHLVTLGVKSLSIARLAEDAMQFQSGEPAFETTNEAIKARYTRVKQSAEPIDETYFTIPSTYAPIEEKAYLKLLR